MHNFVYFHFHLFFNQYIAEEQLYLENKLGSILGLNEFMYSNRI